MTFTIPLARPPISPSVQAPIVDLERKPEREFSGWLEATRDWIERAQAALKELEAGGGGGTGPAGPAGPTGPTGPTGATGPGVATGGTAGQALTKIDATNFNTTWTTLTKTSVGLGNVDNTSDANKPVSTATATALTGKEPTIAAGTTAQYWRGDKSWQALPTGVGEAPTDGNVYARQSSTWTEIPGIGGISPTEYNYNSTAFTPPPNTNNMRLNNANQTLATRMYLHHTNALNIDISNALKMLDVGNKLLLQDKTNAANYRMYQVSAAVIDFSTYTEVPVTYLSGGSAVTAGRVMLAGFGMGSPTVPVIYCFAAHKNGTNQTGIASTTFTKVTFGTENFDTGGFYDAANSRWTPPAGVVHITAAAYLFNTLTAAGTMFLSIHKNGTRYKDGSGNAAGTLDGIAVNFIDRANGTDFYEIFVYATTATTFDVHGDSTITFFAGSVL